MSLFNRLGGLAVAVGLAFTPGHALALTQTYTYGGSGQVTVSNDSQYLGGGPVNPSALPSTYNNATLQTGGPNSPFTNSAFQYVSVAASTASNAAFVTYGGITADVVKFTWGNVSANAVVDFYSTSNGTGTPAFRVFGSTLLSLMGTTFGTNPDVFVTIDPFSATPIGSFKMFTLSSGTDSTKSFNFGNYSYGPRAVPGPIAGAGLPMLLGMLGWLGFRRRRAARASLATA